MKKLIVLPLLILFACTESKPESQPTETKAKNEDKFDAEISAIDNEIDQNDGLYASSFRYTKNNDEYIVHVKAYLNATNEIIKMEEEFKEGNAGDMGRRFFYLKEGKLFASRELYSDMSGKTSEFVDRITYYENEKPVKSKEKRAAFEEELENIISYTTCTTKGVSMDRAIRAFDQKGEFETTFQGFIDVNPFKYLVLGAKNGNGYETTVRVDADDQLITTLATNPTKYLNRKLTIEFETVIDETQFTFQRYLSGKMEH